MFKLIGLSVFGLMFGAPAFAIENLNCELDLSVAYQIRPGVNVRLAPDEVVVRGHLEAQLLLRPRLHVEWSVRDAEGYDRIFPLPADSLHRVRPGDRVYVFDRSGEVFRHGYFHETSRPTQVDLAGEFHEIDQEQPQLFRDLDRRTPLLTSERFMQLFHDEYEAVVIKKIDAETRRQLRAKLEPQMATYRAHQLDAARFVDVAVDRPPYELRVFEVKLSGRLRAEWPKFPKRFDRTGEPPPKQRRYALSLYLEKPGGAVPVREGDRLFLRDGAGDLLAEYEVREHPIQLEQPTRYLAHRSLLEAIGQEESSILIRKVGR